MSAQYRLPRILILALCLLALGAGFTGREALAAPDPLDKAEFQVLLCSIEGGIAGTPIGQPQPGLLTKETITVHCSGGDLGGMVCVNEIDSGYCYFEVEGEQADVRPEGAPEGAIEMVDYEPVVTLKPTMETSNANVGPLLRCITVGTLVVCWPELPEEPKFLEAVIIPSEPGRTVEAIALIQVNGCLAWGGDPQVSMDSTAVTVLCVGGATDGVWCLNDSGGSLCAVLPLVVSPEAPLAGPANGAAAPQDAAPAEDPTQGEPAPTEAPPPPPPTMMPTSEPTVAPTVVPPEVPVEPTVVPTTAPPPPPENDNSLPPGGGVEEPAPTPTEVVLT